MYNLPAGKKYDAPSSGLNYRYCAYLVYFCIDSLCMAHDRGDGVGTSSGPLRARTGPGPRREAREKRRPAGGGKDRATGPPAGQAPRGPTKPASADGAGTGTRNGRERTERRTGEANNKGREHNSHSTPPRPKANKGQRQEQRNARRNKAEQAKPTREESVRQDAVHCGRSYNGFGRAAGESKSGKCAYGC